MAEDNKNFLTSLPGILTGIAAVITAVATLWVSINSNKPDQPPVNPDPPAGQPADPAPDTTATTPQQPGGGTTSPPASQPDSPSNDNDKPVAPSLVKPGVLKPVGNILAINPQLVKTLVAFNQTAIINDPSGFAYVHSAKSSSSPIVTKINSNEKFSTYNQKNETWWRVKTASGKTGYVHVSRIRLLTNP